MFRKRSVPLEIGKESRGFNMRDDSSDEDDIAANSPGHQAATRLRRLHPTRLPKAYLNRPPPSNQRISTIVAPNYPVRESPDIARPLFVPRQRPRLPLISPTPPSTPEDSRTVPQPRREKLCYTYPLRHTMNKQSSPLRTDVDTASSYSEDSPPEEDESADIVDHYLNSDSRTTDDAELSVPRPLHVNPTRHDPWLYKMNPADKLRNGNDAHSSFRTSMGSNASPRPSPLQQCYAGETGVEKRQAQPLVYPKRMPLQELDRNRGMRRPVPGSFPDSSERLTFL